MKPKEFAEAIRKNIVNACFKIHKTLGPSL
jgi:hypothetical protein